MFPKHNFIGLSVIPMNEKVLLVNPTRGFRKGNIWKSIDRCLPPLGIGYIAAYLEQHKVPVEIIDVAAENLSEEEIKYRISKVKAGFIGIGCLTANFSNAIKLAELAKKACPDSKIIFGGVHATIMPEEFLKKRFVDIVALGEAEETMLEIATGKRLEKIDGICFKRNGKIVSTKPREPIETLDSVPFPAYHLLPMQLYRPSLGNYKRLPAISMITSRGCPGKCTFCFTGVSGQRLRFRSARNIADEIKFLIRNYGIKEVSFYDDSFTANRKNVRDLCGIILQEKIDITWSCMSRADLVDLETLKLMKKSGCHQIGYGIESADEKILSNIKKGISIEKVKQAVKLTKQAGIEVRAMFMLGSPGETLETMEKTLKFAIEMNPEIVLFNITTPLPGTEMFHWAKSKGLLTTMDWDDYDLSKMVMRLPTLSAKEIKDFYSKAYKRFYLRPSYIMMRLLKLRSINDVKNAINSFRAVVGI
jgi:radical SAM superfamily enzyme YgiQ (UPF0313 family)